MNRRLISLFVSVVMCGSLVAVGPTPVSAIVDTCVANNFTCKVGDVGPSGGIVYYDAGSQQVWGRFLEAKTNSVPAKGIWGTGWFPSPDAWLASKQIGYGASNSIAMSFDPFSVYSRLRDTEFSDGFFIPSKNELDALYNYWRISGDSRLKYADAPMWTSSQASETFVWYQLFQDGTQFTDANGIIPKLDGKKLLGNKNYTASPVHVGSGFDSTPFQVIGVSAFPNGQTRPAFNYVSVATANPSCSAGGANTVCNIGDIGPGGGIVFYDAGKDEYWGRYLEMAPKACEGVKLPWRPAGNDKTVYKDANGQSAAELRVLAKGVGMGKFNTRVITLALGAGTYAAKYADDSECNNVRDWFLPSKDELDLAYNRLAHNRVGGQDTPVGGFNKGYYWTSTDYNNSTAWSQYFMDGQQFDRVQTLSGNKLPPANPFRVRPIRAFGTNNVVLSCAQGGACKLGDVGPGGGTVFYVAPDRLVANGKSARYLEAAILETLLPWSCFFGFTNLGTRTNIGSGAYNTSLMKKACRGFYDQSLKAGGGKTDWFIPSMDELMYLGNYFVSDSNSKIYWSSSESDYRRAYLQPVPNVQLNVNKAFSNLVRPVRAFG
jgi:hypothetical protein